MNRIRYFLPLLAMLALALSGAAQSFAIDDLPWMPAHVNPPLRCVRQYVPSDSVMGMRKPREVTQYERHGYRTDAGIELYFDGRNRLVRRVELRQVWDDARQGPVWDTASVETVEYDDNGVVKQYQWVLYERHENAVDTTIDSYQLTSSKVEEDGAFRLEYSYRYSELTRPSSFYGTPPGSITDSVVVERVTDGKGRIVSETSKGGSRGLDDFGYRYYYDDYGRVDYVIHSFYGGYDSLAYQYNHAGDLTAKTGKSFVQGYESDIFVSCRPDGTPIMRTEIDYEEEWDYGQNPDQRSVIRTFYDERGNITRYENPAINPPVMEFDNEYWQ